MGWLPRRISRLLLLVNHDIPAACFGTHCAQSDIPMPVATWVMDDVLYRTGGFHCGFG
jgi:hypothetical protein